MVNQKSLVEEFLQDPSDRAEFEQEVLAFQATELIATLMSQQDVKRADLARRIGKSKAYITQLLSGSRNMTIHTFAQLVYALGHKVDLKPVPLSTQAETLSQPAAVHAVADFDRPTWQSKPMYQQPRYVTFGVPESYLCAEFVGQSAVDTAMSA